MFRLKTPISDDTIAEISIGDVLFLDGIVVTARDLAHKLIVEEGKECPINLNGLAIFHAGPIVRKYNNEWFITSIGPTTSYRMEPYEYEFIKRTGVKLIIGKGFMGDKTAKACKDFKAIVALYPGGCGAITSLSIKEVIGVHWLELGVPEALWVLKVKELGPLIVTIDGKGNNLRNYVMNNVNRLKDKITKEIFNHVSTLL